MLTVELSKPEDFVSVLPQLQYVLDHASLDEHAEAELRDRIRIWWRAAEGEWTDSKFSMFRIAAIETAPEPDYDPLPIPMYPIPMRNDAARKLRPSGPSLVVMAKAKATKLNNFHAAFKDIVDAALPLVVAHDVARIRRALHAEFPHAVTAVDLVLRDLREGAPISLKPILLVGSPGCSKSRLVRRLGEITRLCVYRYDGALATDAHFGGTSKAWSNTEASVPARAVLQSKTANPIVMVDEIDKAAQTVHLGRLWHAILPFLERETACRYRDVSLDAELDLSWISHVFEDAPEIEQPPSPLPR